MALYRDLLLSDAYMSLTPKQKALFTCCVAESHGGATKDHAIATGGTGDTLLLYMNKSLYTTKYQLYKANDKRGPRRDLAALINAGLIDCVHQGFAEKSKNVYRLSSRWQDYGKPDYRVPNNCKTLHMLIAEGSESDTSEDDTEIEM